MRWNEGKGWGAIELVGKYDVLNMSDRAFNNAGSGCPTTRLYPDLASTGTGATATIGASSLGLCGEQRTWIIGVNWYLNDYVRLMFDYARGRAQRLPAHDRHGANTSLAPGTICRLRWRNGQGLRHAPRSTGKTTKLEKRNFSPLRCQTAAPKRGGGFFARRPPAPFASSRHAWRDSNTSAQKPSCRLTVTSPSLRPK